MKRALVLSVIVFAAAAAAACAPRYHAHVTDPASEPASRPGGMPVTAAVEVSNDPAPTTEGDVTVAWFRGMQIVVKRTPGAEFVAAELDIRGGTRNFGATNDGVEDLALRVATTGGTQSLAKEQFSRKLGSLGASLYSYSSRDYSTIAAQAPLHAWDELFPLAVESFLAPALPATEFELAKQRQLAGLRHEMENGDGRIARLAQTMIFAGHPYGNRPRGTIDSVTALKAGDLAPYLDKLRDTNRLVLVVIGDVDPAHVIERAKLAFASVPRGSYIDTPVPPIHFGQSALTTDTFKLPTNYVSSSFAGPGWKDPDFIPLWLGMSVLGDRVFDEVRTKRNLSYAPGAWFDYGQTATIGELYVTAVDPNAAMRVMFDEAHKLADEIIPAKEFAGAKAEFVSGYLQGHETVAGQASARGLALILGGDWHLANGNLERIRATNPEAVHNAAHRWFTNVQTAIVGDPTKLDPKIVGAP